MSNFMILAASAGETATKLSTIVTADMLKGVLAEITGLLPVVIPVMISFIAIRKGISFLQSVMRGA
ncbi:MAG: hypothetical protein NC489_24930 [Ruminococcus flavefaciens]|nr:hypothetical protein [Ruminococcus flavefaciens]